MNAVSALPSQQSPAPRRAAKLTLRGPSALPRLLSIRWTGNTCIAHLFLLEPFKPIAFCISSPDDDIRLAFDRGVPSLWLGRTVFDLTADEAKRVRETFGPLGLVIQEPLTPLGAGPLEPKIAPQTDESDLDDDARRWRSGDHSSAHERELRDAGVPQELRT